MYGNMSMRDSEPLFSKVSWHDVERDQISKMQKEVAGMDGDRLLNTSVEDLVSYFAKRFQIEVPTLQVEDIVAGHREAKIDVSRDFTRGILDRNRPHYVVGTEISIEIPFIGDASVFVVQPSSFTYNPPCASIGESSLVIKMAGIDLDGSRVLDEVDKMIGSIQKCLETLTKDEQGLRTRLPDLARSEIEARRQKLLKDRNLVGSLGFKMKPREGSAQTFAASNVRRKIVPSLPPASSSPYKPEPALADADYEHILGVLQNMVQVMERSPLAFERMGEEDIRSHFLVQLNGHFEGQATGETFNYEGKTDILVRSEGRNIFIGECKFWSGPKKLAETIDQVLGYASWRDTKVAIIIFNRNKEFSRVLAAIPDAVKSHSCFKRELKNSSETEFRYSFAHKDDLNRELFLTILAFDVPHKGG